MRKDKREIIYLQVPVHIEYDCPDARKRILKGLLSFDRPWKKVNGGGVAGSWAYETKWRPKLLPKPKRKNPKRLSGV